MTAALLVSLGKQIGVEAARKLFGLLSAKGKSEDRFASATTLMKDGASAIDALRTSFGPEFTSALTAVFGAPTRFTFQKGTQDYIAIPLSDATNAVTVLRDELNINLERLAPLCDKDAGVARNYFLGVFYRWQNRYIELLGQNDDATTTFKAIDSMLDGSSKSFADVVRMLQRTGLGAGGALMIISGAMIATSTGVGLWTWMTTLVFGVPMVTVASLVIPGALLIALATMNFSFTNGMTTSIAAAYKLLDRHKALDVRTDKAPSRAKRVLPSKAKGGTKQANVYDVAAMSILKKKSSKSSVRKKPLVSGKGA